MAERELMTEQDGEARTGAVQKSRRIRLPHVDFVTVLFVILIVFLLLFLTAEVWLPHLGAQ